MFSLKKFTRQDALNCKRNMHTQQKHVTIERLFKLIYYMSTYLAPKRPQRKNGFTKMSRTVPVHSRTQAMNQFSLTMKPLTSARKCDPVSSRPLCRGVILHRSLNRSQKIVSSTELFDILRKYNLLFPRPLCTGAIVRCSFLRKYVDTGQWSTTNSKTIVGVSLLLLG